MSDPAQATSRAPSHLAAVLYALLNTLLWSSSWVLIKQVMDAALPALTFAGLRYVLAWLCLAPLVLLHPRRRADLRRLPRRALLHLAGLGVVVYTLTQGAQFLSLANFPAISTSLVLNLTGIVVAVLGIIFLREVPTRWQWLGIAIATAGMLLYFLPAQFPAGQRAGLFWALVCMLSNAASALLSRDINANSQHSTYTITFISMGVGALLLLALGLITQGMGVLSLRQWLVLLWLAVVNTAFTFTLWNYTLRRLQAVEANLLLNLMVPQIAFLAWMFLGEALNLNQIGGLLLAVVGVILVQVKWKSAPGRL